MACTQTRPRLRPELPPPGNLSKAEEENDLVPSRFWPEPDSCYLRQGLRHRHCRGDAVFQGARNPQPRSARMLRAGLHSYSSQGGGIENLAHTDPAILGADAKRKTCGRYSNGRKIG